MLGSLGHAMADAADLDGGSANAAADIAAARERVEQARVIYKSLGMDALKELSFCEADMTVLKREPADESTRAKRKALAAALEAASAATKAQSQSVLGHNLARMEKIDPNLLRQCAHPACGKRETSRSEFKKCARCKVAVYCTQDCQKAHWKTHKPSCIPPAAASDGKADSKTGGAGDSSAAAAAAESESVSQAAGANAASSAASAAPTTNVVDTSAAQQAPNREPSSAGDVD